MKGAAEFLLQWLQKDPETGYWITNPSTSPENRFRYIDKEGKKQNGEISRSSGMDLGLAWDLLTNCIEASTVLDTDKAFRQQCMDVRANLQPFRIGSKGQLLEWDKEFEETDPNHRHVSHLFALHPGRQIIPEQQPELAAACQRTLEIRGDGGTGWAMAWKINFWARLRDGNHAFGMLKNGLRYVDATQVSVRGGVHTPISSMPIPLSRLTETSEERQALRKCCCKAMRDTYTCYLPCRTTGKAEVSKASAPEADSPSTWNGKKAGLPGCPLLPIREEPAGYAKRPHPTKK